MLAEQYIQAKLCFQEASSVRTAALGDTHPDVTVSAATLSPIVLLLCPQVSYISSAMMTP